MTSASLSHTKSQLHLARNSAAHTWKDDIQGVFLGVFLTSLAVTILKANQQLTGGTAGVAFLLHYVTGANLDILFAATNAPFLALAWKIKGWQYALRATIATFAVTTGIFFTPTFIQIDKIAPIYSAVVGGGMLGVGCLALIRHNAPVGGLGILCVLLQEKYGVSAGKIQGSIDIVIIAAALLVVSPASVIYSAIGAVFAASVIAFNHKEGRYIST